jgi:50S ribosomal protein uL3
VLAEGDPANTVKESCGLIALDGKAWWAEDASAVETRRSGAGGEIRWSWPDGAEMRLTAMPEGADIVFRLSGKAPAPGLIGCRWALPGVSLHGRQLYLPETYTGLLVDGATPPGKLALGGQPGWSHTCALSFIQGERGTLGCWSEERSGCEVLFHGEVLPGERAQLEFEAHGQPPYAERREVATATWRLAATRGGWQSIAVGDVFTAGDWVDVMGTSIGRGFQGVMRRWNFAGGTRTHGTHEYRRHGGSIGQNMTPGRTWPNKGMPGQNGNKRCTAMGIRVARVLPEENVVMVEGGVPGSADAYVEVRGAAKSKPKKKAE